MNCDRCNELMIEIEHYGERASFSVTALWRVRHYRQGI